VKNQKSKLTMYVVLELPDKLPLWEKSKKKVKNMKKVWKKKVRNEKYESCSIVE
jgi:hypothetical protein